MMKPLVTTAPLLFVFSASSVGVAAQHSSQSLFGNANQSAPPNIVFIVADDIGYGDLSPYGFSTVQTPNVERLARQGLRFTDAHSVAATSTPSRYSLLTGEYSWRRTDTHIARGDAGLVIRPQQFTIADMCRSKGYATAAIGKWHLGLGDSIGTQDWNGTISPGLQDIGFDYSYIMAATGDRVPCVFIENQKVVGLDASDPIQVSYTTPFEGEPTGRTNPELLTVMRPSHGHDMAIINGISRIGYMKGGKRALWKDEEIADNITAKAVQYINQHKDKPFFLWFCTNDIHVPRVPHPRFVGKSGMGPRGDAIVEFDWTVGQILDALDRNGIANNTIVVLTSDNGPVVDDGYKDQAVELLGNHKPAGNYRGGKYSNFEAGTRVPLFVRYPGYAPAGGVSAALVSHIDLFSSLAHCLGYHLREGEASDSRNMWQAFIGKDSVGAPYVLEHGNVVSVSDGRWKYIPASSGAVYNVYTRTEMGNSKHEQLYDLITDFRELYNVAEQYPHEVARLRAIYESEAAKKIYPNGVYTPIK